MSSLNGQDAERRRLVFTDILNDLSTLVLLKIFFITLRNSRFPYFHQCYKASFVLFTKGVAATWWDQFLLLVVQTDGAAASLDLEDTSATDVYLPLIMDSQIASVSGYFYFRLLIFEI